MPEQWQASRRGRRRPRHAAPALVCALLLAGCTGPAETSGPDEIELSCSIPTSEIFQGGPGKDGIPALTDPPLLGQTAPDDPETSYLADDDRVIGLVLDGEPIAIPHNILWFHEIVNLDRGGLRLAITYCPLTGSSLAFDRSPIGGGEFGVSGLLFNNNLIMYDRTSEESLWPQMMRTARCGPRDGAVLPMHPVVDMTWGGWKSLHPVTKVVSSSTGHAIDYRRSNYPYGNYESTHSPPRFPMGDIDDRRPPKERVIGIPAEGGGIAFPFGELDDDAAMRAVHAASDGEPVVVFWDGSRRAAAAFRPELEGQRLTFTVADGEIVDAETGTSWHVDGRAAHGPLAGARLEPITEAYVAFWFAWAAFHPETTIWNVDATAT